MSFRLEHDKDHTRTSSHTYIVPRMFPFITGVIWAVFAAFFRKKIRANIYQICPQGKLLAIGGKLKRNIQTLGREKKQPKQRTVTFLWSFL